MCIKKITIGVTLPLFLVSFLFSQSLAELAKKEKERRAKLKSKKTTVVTNTDLAKLKKQPAVFTPQSELIPEESAGIEESPEVPPEEEMEILEERDEFNEELEMLKSQLKEKWDKSKEYVSLLTTRMNGLWQEFYSLDDMTSRDKIQQDISETFLKLQKAQQDEAKAKKEYEDISSQVSNRIRK